MEEWQEFFIKTVDIPSYSPSRLPNGKSETKKEFIENFCHNGNGATLTKLSMKYQPKVIAEMGTGWGIRTALLARLNPNSVVHTIEISSEMGGNEPGLFAKSLKNVVFVRGNSNDWVLKDVELCFIDADHSEQSVLLDSRRAFANRKEDNWCIVWDDYPLPEVCKSVDLFVKEVGYTLKGVGHGYVHIGSRE